MFVDDGSLALVITVIVLLSSIFATLMPDLSPAAWRRALGRFPWRALRQCHESSTAVVTRRAMIQG